MTDEDDIVEHIEKGGEIEEIPLKVHITNPPQEKDNTQWEEEDPWEFTKMSEEDIKEAEESRNA